MFLSYKLLSFAKSIIIRQIWNWRWNSLNLLHFENLVCLASWPLTSNFYRMTAWMQSIKLTTKSKGKVLGRSYFTPVWRERAEKLHQLCYQRSAIYKSAGHGWACCNLLNSQEILHTKLHQIIIKKVVDENYERVERNLWQFEWKKTYEKRLLYG